MWKLNKSERTGLLAFSIIIAAVCVSALFFRRHSATPAQLPDSIRSQMEIFRKEIHQQLLDTVTRKERKRKGTETRPSDINPLEHPIERE